MKKSAIFALAVVVVMGSMAVAALADESGTYEYGVPDSSVSSQPQQGAQPEQGVDQPSAGEIREPMETGSVPERTENLSDVHMIPLEDQPAEEVGGQLFRPGIDTGP